MSSAALRARYLGDTVATASPQQLLVMLYDRLALDLERAQSALTDGDRSAAGVQLQHAQEIVIELQGSLQIDAWESGPRLASLYTWLLTELITANVKGDLRRVADCRKIVEPLRDAWTEAAASLASSPA
jgi:flagellar protein FliS